MEVDSKVYTGVTHEVFGIGAVVTAARTAVEQAAGGLKKSFEAPQETATR